jgi:O-antigen/teichoic acid export membrane protein
MMIVARRMRQMMKSLLSRLSCCRFWRRGAVFDRATDEGRAKARHHRILLTTLAAAIAKIVAVGTSIVSVPLTLHYLGVERFGLWMTISSLIAILNFADLGIGNGLLNAIAEASGKDDDEAIRRHISSAFAVLGVVAVLILVVFYAAYPFIPWAALFNVQSTIAERESGLAVAVFTLCFALSIPASVVQKAQLGLQMGFTNHLWLIVGNLLGLAGVLIAIRLEVGLPWLVGAMAGAPLFATCMMTIFFIRTKPQFRPRLKLVNIGSIRIISQIGLLFFVLQVSASVMSSVDNVLISNILGAEAVTQNSVSERIFSVIPMFLGTILAPLWPAYGEAISHGDGNWVRRVLRKSLITTLVVSSGTAAAILYFAHDILAIWIGPGVSPPIFLLIGLAVWKVAEACGAALSMFLNGANVVRIQVILSVLFIALAIPLKILMLREIGIAGAVWATVASYVAIVVLPYLFLVPKILAEATRRRV